MARLLFIQGPEAGREYFLEDRPLTFGRQLGVDLVLDAVEVSRSHARITPDGSRFFLEDLGSSNGTYLNGARLEGKAELHEQDEIKIGPFLLRFAPAPTGDAVIRASMPAHTSNRAIFQQDPAGKLLAVLEIARHLARTLDLDELLPKLLDHLLRLFPQADRGLVLLQEGDHLAVRAF